MACEQFVDESAHLDFVQVREIPEAEHFLAELLDDADADAGVFHQLEHPDRVVCRWPSMFAEGDQADAGARPRGDGGSCDRWHDH